MNWKALIISNLFVIVLVIGLAVTRVIRYMPDEDLAEIQEIELAIYEPPAEKEIEELHEPEPLEDVPPPPPPSFDELVPSADPTAVSLPTVEVQITIDAQTDLFSTERAPAPLIVEKRATPEPKPTKPKLKIGKVKRDVGLGDLDAKPRVLRKGILRWPRGVRSGSVNAVLRIELNQSGRATLLKVVSLDDERFRSMLSDYVKTTRFTVPKKDGKPVGKVVFHWPNSFQKR
ncbi:hypothetical protein [Rubritalea marina]|uniref:hypothetical protein n=1 Tax=Rubritalea marina TaxID=361055 RepID=UPI00036FF783|nr:hypothetical protein [Rubritalea marina]